jgi:hypothetical protein
MPIPDQCFTCRRNEKFGLTVVGPLALLDSATFSGVRGRTSVKETAGG